MALSNSTGSRLEALLTLFEKDPKDSFIQYGIALEYISANQYEKAEEFFKLIIKNDPAYIPAYMQYGLMKAKLNKKDEAGKIFENGIKIAIEFGDKHAAKEMEAFLDELK